MSKIKRALISVSDKEGVVEFAASLKRFGIEIISTGGTAKILKKKKIPVVEISDITGFPECLDGRVKTLHPVIHTGILAVRRNREHMQKLKELGINPIDLVVVNLYPFKETIAKKNVKLSEAIENIDIGGPTMIRSAAKNYASVAIVVNPERYYRILDELKKSNCKLSLQTRQILAKEAFEHTAAYDSLISTYLREKFSKEPFPKQLSFTFEKVFECAYGENPHQKAAFYKEPLVKEPCITSAKQLNGKKLSFNNLNDSNAAVELLKEFKEPTAVIVKHTNPCGVASGKSLSEAFKLALECDSLSAFGGIIALNRKCDLNTAKQITSFFNEVVIAPEFGKDALKELKKKANLRVLKIKGLDKTSISEGIDVKRIELGILVQSKDAERISTKELNIVSKEKPTREQIKSLLFARKVCKHVKSNAIVLATGTATVGIGAGQMSRVECVELAIKKAGYKARGSVMASDGFFPFRDSIDIAAEAGVSAIIEPGGSIKDKGVIEAANEKGIGLIFTGIRQFRH